MVKQVSLSNILLLTLLMKFIRFLSVLSLSELRLTSFRIWSWIAESISYDDNRCTTNVISDHLCLYLQ